jgi:asparagine synthase (glutamine-hydrolysing)
MCGISGFIIKNNEILKNIDSYNKSLIKYLHNRGPDQEDTYVFNNLSLNHNRLSINDLDTRSKQPFYFKNLVMIFNGEIYNFKQLGELLIQKYKTTFIGTSDTEILIQLFYFEGIKKTLELLNGIFAIALFNTESNEVIIIRDRIGIKYCYYYEDENIFMFASNPGAIAKTLFEINNIKFDLNIPVLFSYLSSGICLSSESMFKNIKGIDSGNYLKFNLNSISYKIHKWYIPNFNREHEDIEEYIKSSIEIQEIGDVGKNILYSGGIDSNILATYSNKSKLITLGVGEQKVAQECASLLNKNLKIIDKIFLEENLSKFIDEQRKIINFSGIPIKSSYLMNMTGKYLKENESDNKILLTGIGGNELFYGHRRIKLNNKGFKSHLRDLYLYLSQIKPLDNKYNEEFQKFKTDFANKLRKQINIPDDLKNNNISRWLEIQTFLLNDLLINADNIYMYYSIEARVPLLDHNIFEIALSKDPKEFFYDFDKLGTATWNEYTTKSKKPLKDILLHKLNDEIIFKEKYSYDIERHKIHPFYLDLCNKFLERKIIGWNGAFTKYNSHLVGNIELWFQEYDYLLEI